MQGLEGKLAENGLNGRIAIKTINTNAELVAREITVAESIRHPNFIRIMAVCVEAKQFHIVTEYFISDSLSDVIFDNDVKLEYNMDINNKNHICDQICKAVAYICIYNAYQSFIAISSLAISWLIKEEWSKFET